MRPELRSEDEGFAGVGGGVRVADDAVRREAGLQHELRLGAEVLRAPQHDVGELADLDGADLVGEAVRDGRVDGQLGHVAQDALVVVALAVAGLGAELGLHLPGHGEGAADGLAGAAHALRVGGGDADDAEVVQHVLGAHRPGADPVAGHGGVAGQVGLQVVDGDDHAVVLGDRVPAEGQGRVGGGADDVRRRPPSSARSARVRRRSPRCGRRGWCGPSSTREGVLDGQALVQPVAVQGDLDVVLLGDAQRGVEGAGVRAHVLVHLEAGRAALGERLDQRRGVGGRTRGRGSRC